MAKRANPIWEWVAIFFAIAALWPRIIANVLHWPAWLTWGLLVVALALMVLVFVRRVRRLLRLEHELHDAPPGRPPGHGPRP